MAIMSSQVPLQPLALADVGIDGGSFGSFDQRSRSPYSVASIPMLCRGLAAFKAVDRYRWSSRLEFIQVFLALIHGLKQTVDLPTIALANGKGGFVLAYFVLAAFMALPLTYLQAVLGQYWNQGAVGLWRTLPLCYGLGGLAS